MIHLFTMLNFDKEIHQMTRRHRHQILPKTLKKNEFR